ncbi:hypothetical protein [Flavobacterium sp. XGLA_31]|uniref:hypothetical protein n=1 Tax=Flavobacterium sp. XGLA_31 TaxID=3447666 RepID=UPI003F2A22C5
MHPKTKEKLKRAIKLYTVEPEHGKAYEIKIQLPYGEYIEIELNQPFPKRVIYKSLEHGGFNYDPSKDTRITHNSRKHTIRILKNSIDFRHNNLDTINKLILLIEEMSEYI